MAPTTCSREAATAAWRVEMAVAKAVGVTLTMAEATMTTSTDGGVAMSKSVGRSGSRPEQEIRAGSEMLLGRIWVRTRLLGWT
jgi:hypothetical protein